MKFSELNNKQVEMFIQGLEENEIRQIFSKSKLRINGFRKGSEPLHKIEELLIKNFDKPRSNVLVVCDSYFKKFVIAINRCKDFYLSQGYPEEIAEALSIKEILAECKNDNIKKLYYTLEEFEDEKIIKLENIMSYQILIDKNLSDFMSKIDSNKNNDVDTKLENFDDKINDIQNKYKDLNEKVISFDHNIENLKQELLNEHRNNEQNKKNEIDKRLKTLEKQNKNFENSMNCLKEDIITLTKEINNLEQNIKLLATNNNIEVTNIVNDDFEDVSDSELFDYYLAEYCLNYTNEVAIALKGFIYECLYSPKGIIAFKYNSINVAKVIASLIAGGTYSIIKFNRKNFEVDDLLDKISQIQSENNTSVILIKDFVTYEDIIYILEKCKQNPNHKLIFEYTNKNDLIFIPEESVNYINPFLFNISADDLESNYRFILNEQIGVKNLKILALLEELGHNSNVKVYNKDINGYLALSLIPFLAIYDNINIKEIIAKITDLNIRNNCEDIINHVK